jgi:hypothetical protein
MALPSRPCLKQSWGHPPYWPLALIFAAALGFGLGTVSSVTYACNEKAAQAEDATGLIQVARDQFGGESDEGTDEEGSGEGGESE